MLVGFAYDAGPAEVRTFTVQRTQEYFEGMAWLTGADMQPEGALDETVTTEGMVTLMPVDGWDIDDYQFRGEVKIVWGMSMLGQRAWRIRLTVMRRCRQDMPDEDIDLDVVVTERVWRGNAPPQIGQEIQGHLWLQGRLLQVCPDGTNV